ncbi:MAG: enoyl-CoA hydratase [Bradyrhizobium sp.]|nr:enoyl-CoA hydratase [Bradyrhizobium sp.]
MSDIVIESDGAVTLWRIARPSVRNALDHAASTSLSEAVDRFEADPAARVAILTGQGDTFCAGGDLTSQHAAPPPATGFGGLTARFDRRKPIIAAVNGAAIGGGFELALACDLIVAADTAEFALPEPRLGLAALAGGLLRLPCIIGEKRALGIILTARRVGAAEGQALGFIHQVSAVERLLPEARNLAALIAELAPLAITASLDVVRRGLACISVEIAMAEQESWPSVRALRDSTDRREGIRAFREHRPPHWTGR